VPPRDADEQTVVRCQHELAAQPSSGAEGCADGGAREIVMTMQNNQSSGSSFFQSVTGQMLAFGVGIAALIVLAAVFVF
jgi:hypothetical protein